jgi:hypothetical protein
MQAIVHELSAIDKADLALIRRHYSPSRRGRIRNTIWTHGELATAVLDGDLRPRDEQDVTDALVAALPAVPADDPSWDSAVDQLRPGQESRRPSAWWLATTTIGPADILTSSAWNPDAAPDDFDWEQWHAGGGLTPGDWSDQPTSDPVPVVVTPADDPSLLPGEFIVPDAPDFGLTRRPGYEASLNAAGIELMPICGGAPDADHFEPSTEDWADYREMQERATVQAYFGRRGYSTPTDDELAQLAGHGCI